MAVTIYCQVVLYFEIRHHEKEIAAQQVSVKARQKFLNDKKAFKLTTTVLLILVLTYSPIMVVRILVVKPVLYSANFTLIAFFTATFAVVLNSPFNPIIYCARIR